MLRFAQPGNLGNLYWNRTGCDQHFWLRQIAVAYHGTLSMQGLDVLKALQQRRQLRCDCLLNHLPRSVSRQFVQAQTDLR